MICKNKKRKRIIKEGKNINYKDIKGIKERNQIEEKAKKGRKKDMNKNKKKREKNNLSYILRCPC